MTNDPGIPENQTTPGPSGEATTPAPSGPVQTASDPDNSAAAQLRAEMEAARSGQAGQTRGNGKNLAVLGLGILVAGGALYAINRPVEEPAAIQQTATADPYDDRAGIARLSAPPPRDTSAEDDLRAKLMEALEEIDALKNRPVEAAAIEASPQELTATVSTSGPSVEMEELADLRNRLDGLTTSFDEREKELNELLKQRDTALIEMQSQLDQARLAGGSVSSDIDLAAERRKEAEDAYQSRVNSGMIALGGGSSGGDPKEGDTNPEQERRRISQNEAFAREAATPAAMERAQVIVNPSNTIMQGTMIQATLETVINSDLPGAIRAVVSEDVHSYDGARLLIPRGSKVIGQYSDQVEVGQRRAMVVWSRIILPDNQTVTLAGIGGDPLGQSGLSGSVNTHAISRFGGAILTTALALAPIVAVATDDDEDNGSSNDRRGDAAAAMSQSLATALSPSLSRTLSRPPTIVIKQGSSVTIMVDRDLEIL